MTLSVVPYEKNKQLLWDDFVKKSKNGTFLLERNYIEYHQERFIDNSLLITKDDTIIALLPGNRKDNTFYSHQGLTYGGLIIQENAKTPNMIEVFSAVLDFLKKEGVNQLIYKTIPYIYHLMPAEEDRYALFLKNAKLTRRDVLSVVKLSNRPALQERRKRGKVKAIKSGAGVFEAENWEAFWTLLTEHLLERFNVPPVHSFEEIKRLKELFPNNIRLFTVEREGTVIAGTVIYESKQVAHVQYIASSHEGREVFALDLLFIHLLEEIFRDKLWFDFGISNENNGLFLNEGLIEQKEGFGGRAVVHDFYEVEF